jgi:hypothetical protein
LVYKKEHKKIKLQFNKKALLEGEEELLNDTTNTVELGPYESDPNNSVNTTGENVISDEQPVHVRALLRCMKSGPIPNVSVKYSVEKLSEQWMIHSLLLSDEQFDIKHVDLSQDKFVTMKEHSEALSFFQDNYHFDSTPDVNWNNFMMYYGDKYSSDGTRSSITSSLETDIVKDFLTEFLNVNKEIQQKFSDAWMYKKVLEIKDPTRTEVTNDLIDLVYYQTNIPKDKIKTIYDQAIRFKDKHKIDHILQHEGHINGPWEFDNKGDVAFEDKLTFLLLAQRKYNSYSHDTKEAVNLFNTYVVDARKAFDKSDELSPYLANDSYSYRQGILYGREDRTGMIDTIQHKEASLLLNDAVDVVKFKMGEKVIPPNTAVYAVTKEAVSISREQIEADSEMLAFILVNEQLKHALKNTNVSNIARDNMINILSGNDDTCHVYKKDLASRYKYVEFSRKDYQLTQFLEGVEEVLAGGDIKKLKKKKIGDLDRTGLNIIHKIVVNYVDGVNGYPDNNNINTDSLLEVIDFLSDLRRDCQDSKVENAINSKTISFGNEEDLKEINFLASVEIDRKNPIKNLLEDHPKLRLINKFVHESQLKAKEEEVISCSKKLKN